MRFRRDEGFTLVELMVVVLIIGILVAIAIPVFNTARASAWQRTCYANQRTIEGAVQTFQADTGDLPTAIGDLEGEYLKVMPECPRPGSSCETGYALDTDGMSVVGCTGGTDGGDDHGYYLN